MAFDPTVERWRSLVSKYAGSLPVDFLLAWMQIESDGIPGTVSSIGERGLYQIHPDEKAELLKLSNAAWDAELSKTDATQQVIDGVKLANVYVNWAKKTLQQVGQTWNGQDFYKLVKLFHAASAVPKYTILGYYNRNGTGPQSWDDLENFAFQAADQGTLLIPKDPSLSARINNLTKARRVWNNADTVGGVVPPAPAGPSVASIVQRIVSLFAAV
jgi:Transglycosylase SLT domain